jgi:hypothetical protein
MNWFTDEEKRAIIAATPLWIAWIVAIGLAVQNCRKSLCDTECEGQNVKPYATQGYDENTYDDGD